MRLYGLHVHASDIEDRGCPDSELLDFFAMTRRPWGCDVLLSNPPFAEAMRIIEHAWKLEFRLIVFLLRLQFLSSEERYTRLHPLGRLRRVHVFAERVQGMHDFKHVAAGGKLSSQSQDHGWFVFDRDYFGPATINPISIHRPTLRMPWLRNEEAIVAEAAE